MTKQSPPAVWFIPVVDVLHPETLQPIMEADVAYSIAAFQTKCDETGVDYAVGKICTLNCARYYRKQGQIKRFVLLKSEE